MNYEFSAGGLIIKKQTGKWFLLVLKDMSGNWTFPKGLIDKKEKAEEAARREIKEETGIEKIVMLSKIMPIEYWYKRNGRLIKKSVEYFLFEELEDETPKPQIEEGISEIQWIPLDKVSDMIGYKNTNQKLIEEAKIILKNRKIN